MASDSGSPASPVRLLVLVLCVALFFVVCWPQMRTYLDEDTSSAVSYRNTPLLPMPTLVFCPRQGPNDDDDFDVFRSSSVEYRDRAPFARLDMRFVTVTIDQFNRKHELPKYKRDLLYTVYNGVCDAFTFEELFEPQWKLYFNISSEKSALVFLLPHESDQILLTSAPAQANFETFHVTSDLLVGLSRTEHTLLPDIEANKCIDGNSSEGIFGKCVAAKMEETFVEKNVTCVPIMHQKFMPDFDHPLCDEVDKNVEAISYAIDVVSKANLNKLSCKMTCTTSTISTSEVPMKVGLKDTSYLDGKHWIVLIYYMTDSVEIVNQYLVYSDAGILSAVGGALGMFLGWSFYQSFGDVWHFLKGMSRYCKKQPG